MFFQPQDPDPDFDPEASRFEIFDLQIMLGYGLIAWAFACSIGLSLIYT